MSFKTLSLITPLALVLVTGCSGPSVPNSRPSASMIRASHEIQMRKTWVGKTYSQLAESKGSKGMQMNIPGTGASPNFVVVYDTDAQSGCIDAFRISQGETAIVDDYFCR